MTTSGREYDIVLFGATGFTGQYTAEHIVHYFPTDLKWAISGRSQSKLEKLAESLKKLNPDRKAPAIETVQLHLHDLKVLAKKTKILLNTVGPYALYGEPVVAACADNGTHYLDVTGESPWVKDMIEKYDSKAKQTGAIIIPQIGVESAPAEMLTYALTSFLRKEQKVFTKEVIVSLHKIKGSFSGGTLATVLNIFNSYSIQQIAKSGTAQSMCPRAVAPAPARSLASKILGITTVPDLGTLTTSIQASADIPIVHRSWGLLYDTEESYGPNFRFGAYMTARNAFTAALSHLVFAIVPLFLLFPPVRSLVAKFVYQPGQGQSRDDSKNNHVEYRGIAVADTTTHQRAFGRLVWDADLYHLTGVFLSEAAGAILADENIAARKLGGGLLTPATLGQGFIDRLTRVGVRIETKMLS